ncbi:hypothetical protein AAHE18_20G234100 [Arachis hypogaea]
MGGSRFCHWVQALAAVSSLLETKVVVQFLKKKYNSMSSPYNKWLYSTFSRDATQAKYAKKSKQHIDHWAYFTESHWLLIPSNASNILRSTSQIGLASA